jgi:hypothetical protein
MTFRSKDLELRQCELKIQSSQERKEFEERLEVLKKPLYWADKRIDTFLFLRNNPQLMTSAFTALVHCNPKLASKLLVMGLGVIKCLKNARKLI